jgi:hypothetical protein
MKRIFGLVLGALLIALPVVSSAANADGRIVSGPMFGAPTWHVDATTPSVVPSYIAVVLQEASTPCFNCLNGHEAGTFGAGDPLGYVNTNLTALAIMFVNYNVSDTGPCTVTVSLKQGTTTLATGTGTFTPTPAVIYSYLRVTRQATWHGAATTTGKLVCGALTLIQNGKVYFQ